jgi:hypothetical protein
MSLRSSTLFAVARFAGSTNHSRGNDMRKLPDMSGEAEDYFAVVKRMLAECIKQGEKVIPLHAILTLNPEAAESSGQSQCMVVPQWEQGNEKEKAACLQKFADLCTRDADCVILAGCGTSYQPRLGTAPSLFLFVTIYLPGYESWTTGVTYAVFDQDIGYGDAYNSTDHIDDSKTESGYVN